MFTVKRIFIKIKKNCTLTEMWWVLTIGRSTHNHCVPGLCPSPGILNTRKHNVSEIGSVSILR
jgi:hypothetical protein